MRKERPVLVVPHVQYDELLNTMFHMIRQHAAGNATVLIRLIQVLTAVASCEHDADRLTILQKHAGLVLEDAERSILTSADLADARRHYREFEETKRLSCSAIR